MMKNQNNQPMLWLFVLLSALVTAFVFGNSLKSGDASMAESDSVVAFLQPLLDRLPWLADTNYSVLIRKLAHFAEFFALGFFYGGTMCLMLQKNGKPRYFSVLFSVLFVAVIDEYIQSFTGRTSSVKDVLIDFSGALTGLGIVFGLFWLIACLKSRKKKSNVP